MNELKKKIIEAGIRKQLSIMNDFRQRIKDITKTDANVNEEEYDSQVQSQKAEVIAEADLLSDQLQFAAKELEQIRKIETFLDEGRSVVGFGTVVQTDRGTFFVSASIEEFEVGDITVFGLSVYSPLYRSMRGKKAGQTFRYGTRTYTIKKIF